MTKPFRFAVQLETPFEGRTWADSCRELEDLGYSSLLVPDHLDEGLGPIAAMASAAAVTTHLRVGALVLDCDFRHPAVLARELATIDQLSGGRLEVGVGAGWKRTDYEYSGIPMDRPGVRVSRMIEHARVLKAYLSGNQVDHDGEHYGVSGLPADISTHAPGGPPFMIGGGAPRLLRFAGGFADIVGVNPSIHSGEIDAEAARDGMPERIDEKFSWVAEGASDRDGGSGFDDIEFNAWLAAAEITEDRDGIAELLGEMFGVEPGTGLESPVVLVGTESQVTENLHARRERWGFSYTVIPGDKAHDFAPVVGALTGT